jgi:hypothetical protein
MRPTSIRLTPEQEAQLAVLADALPRVRPDLTVFVRGGVLTPGAVLRLALVRGRAALRRDVGADEAVEAPL